MTKAHDPGDDLFCEHRLEAVLDTHAGRGSREVVGGVAEALEGSSAGPADNDITMLALRCARRRRIIDIFGRRSENQPESRSSAARGSA